MRTFIWTITALIAATLVLATPSSCQSTDEKETQEALAAAKADAQSSAGEAQQQAQEALKQADAAQKQAEDAALQAQERAVALSIATNAPSQTPSSAYQFDRSLSLGMSPHASQSVLVIPIDEIKAEDIATITEDLGIMCRVLDKKLEQDLRNAMVARFPFGGNIGPEGIYLEGYGALFLLNVSFPLVPPPETKKEEQPKEEGDTFWEETKHELYSTREYNRNRESVVYITGLDRSTEEYDPEKIEQLKTTLIRSLKHAANLRNIKPDESVIITVRGCAPATVIEETVVERNDSGSRARSKSISTTRSVPVQKIMSEESSVASAVLTLRAKKSDIDAFSKGELTLDQFRQKVRIHTYQTSGRNMIPEPSQR